MPNRTHTTAARLVPHPLVHSLILAGLIAAVLGVAPARAGGTVEDGVGWAGREATGEPAAATDRLIVRYREDIESDRRTSLSGAAPRVGALALQRLQSAGLQAVHAHRNALGAQVIQLNRAVSAGSLAVIARELMANDPDVLYAEPDRRMRPLATPTDPYYASQWHYFEAAGGLSLPAAWDVTKGAGVVVAVIDTGVRAHADLAGNLLPGRDFISSSSVANDGDGRDADAADPGDGCNGARSSWHGTHVAGTVAALANNGLGGTGVAPAAAILPARVLGCGGGYTSDIADAVIWASGGSVPGAAVAPRPARVLNLSLGGRGACATTMQAAIQQARSRGAVVVVAAGNANQDAGLFAPANCEGVITVAAVGRSGGRAGYSNFGTRVDVAAPGGDQSTGAANGVLSTLNAGYSAPAGDTFAYYQGTSMAAPHVAGTAALMLARAPGLTPDELEILLKSTARALPVACPQGCGAGIVSASAAVNAVFLGGRVASGLTEVEPNNTRAAPQTLTGARVKVAGTVASATDLDLYKVNVGVGRTVMAQLIGNDGANYDLELHSTAASNSLLARSANALNRLDSLSWTNKGGVAVDVFLRVSRVSGNVGAAGTYTLEVAR